MTLIALAGAGWWLFSLDGGIDLTGGQTTSAMSQYAAYTGDKPGLLVTFEYPQGWDVHEEQGKAQFYREVRILGPRNQEETYTAYLSVRGSPLKPFGGRHEALDELVANYKNHLLQGAQIVSEQPRTIGGTNGVDLTVSYIMPAIHHKGLKAQAVPVTSRTVFLENGPYLCELTFSADAREYEQHAPAFEHLLGSFRFQ